MERWEALVEGYPSVPTPRDFSRAVESAKVVQKEDLAPFEMDWLLQTFLAAPVNALSVLSLHYHDDAWSNVISRCLELLTTMVTDHMQHVHVYMEDIVQRCTHQYSVHARKRALQLLIEAATRAPASALARVFARACEALATDEPVTARAVRAHLVGTLCEYHPELLASEQEIQIWRVYLTILEASKTTDSLINGVLLGLNGLFKHFGMNLPTSELNNFYNKLSSKYLLIPSCLEACLQLLSSHSHLFPERVRCDVTVRSRLWSVVTSQSAARALLTVYERAVTEGNVQSILTTEIYPRTGSKMAAESNTANRILCHILRTHHTGLDEIRDAFGKQVSSLCTSLEFALASKVDTMTPEEPWEYDHGLVTLVQQASWCIEWGQGACDGLLRSVLVLYPHIAPSRRRQLVTHTLLNADPALRTAAITFLISESCASPQASLALWREIFDTQGGTDKVVMDKSKLVLDDVLGYVLFVLGFAMDSDLEKSKERVSSLLLFASQIIEMEVVKDYLTDYVESLLDLTLDCSSKLGASEGLVRFVSTLVAAADEACMLEDGSLSDEVVEALKRFYQSLRIDRCGDEALLCACCLALTHAPDAIGDVATRLQALQVVFARTDVEPKTSSQALRKFENLLNDERTSEFGPVFDEIISNIGKLSTRKDATDRDSKILRRDVLMFLGKYGDKPYFDCAGDGHLNKLKDLLVLSLPNPADGTNLKINLKRTLDLALTHEDPKTLNTLLLILCSHLATKQEPLLHEALTLVIYKLSKCLGRGEAGASETTLERAVSLCPTRECCTSLIQYITTERSPGVRKILSLVLETCLVSDVHSDTCERALRVVTERTALMMDSCDSATKRAGLDLVETIIAALKENHELTKEIVPNLLISILKTDERGFEVAYGITSTHFLDKIVMFPQETLEYTVNGLLKGVNAISDGVNLKLAVDISMATVKDILQSENWEVSKTFLDIFTQLFKEQTKDAVGKVKHLLLLARAKEILDLDYETCTALVSMDDFLMLKMVRDLLEKKDDINFEAVFRTLGVFAAVALEVKYLMTLEYLGLAIAKSSPKFIKNHHKISHDCLKTYQKLWNNTPLGIVNSFKTWCGKLPLKTITENMEVKTFVPKQAMIIFSMKKLFEIVNLPNIPDILLEQRDEIKKWPKILLHYFASSHTTDLFKSKMADLTDILTVALYFLTDEDVTEIILEGWQLHGMDNERVGFKFCKHFMRAFAPTVLGRGLLLREEMKCCALLVHDLIKYCSKNKPDDGVSESVMDLVDQLWPTLNSTQPFCILQNILTDLSTLNTRSLTLESNLGQWWLDAMTGCARDDERVKLMTSLPVLLQDGVAAGCRERYVSALRCYSEHTPRRLQGSTTEPHIRALLDAVARTGEQHLLELMVACVAQDNPPAWLESSLRVAMATLAVRQSAATLKALHTLCDGDQLSVALHRRALVPLIRHSSTSVCLDFFSATLGDALSSLWKKTREYPPSRAFVTQLTRALILFTTAFEKLPLSDLQSPSSRLYANIRLRSKATIVQELCMLCHASRSQVRCPDDAGDELKSCVRQFHQAAFNCFATVFCRTQPDVKFYDKTLLKADVLQSIRSERSDTTIHIEAMGRVSTVRLECPERAWADLGLTCRATALARTGTALSDNPLAYDFLAEQAEEQMPPQTIVLPDNALNAHPCCPPLTAAVGRLANQVPRIGRLEELMMEDIPREDSWLLTQIILNCKQELKEHSWYLTPALLRVVATTPYESQGKRLLNGLHVNAVNTIIQWSEEAKQKPVLTQDDKDHIQSVFDLLLSTGIHHRSRLYVLKSCMSTLNGFLKLYGEFVRGKWEFFEEVLKDTANESVCLEILIAVTKHKIHIPELLGKVLAKLESKQSLANKLAGTAELYGLALAASRSTDLSKFWKVLERLRSSNSQEYVKLLFYAQNGSKECCNEIHFRHIADLTPKMLREQKSKCFEILAAYISRFSEPNEYISDMYESIDLCEAIATGDHRLHALKVAKNGLRIMPDALKRRVVFLTCDVCSDSAAKVRRAAFEVVLEAFKDIFTPPTEPPAKRLKAQTATKLLHLLEQTDVFGRTVVATIGRGVADRRPEVAALVADGVAAILAESDIVTRFLEALLVTVTLPSIVPATSGSQPAVCVANALSVVLKLSFGALTGCEAFRRLKLREEPLEFESTRPSSGPSKLLTMSKTFQGTFRSSSAAKKRPSKDKTGTNEGLNVQVPLQETLESFLQFAQSGADAATVFFIETVRALQKIQGGDGVTAQGGDSTLNKNLALQMSQILGKGVCNDLTPVVLQLCRLCVDECCALEGFKPAVKRVKDLTVHTNGEGNSQLLYEEVLMRENFGTRALGASRVGEMDDDNDDDDDQMGDEGREFSVEGLVSAFGKLANWDQLTLRDKRAAERSISSPIWTDHEGFREALEDYQGTSGWLSKMRQSLSPLSKGDHYRWLRQLEKWPVRPFAVSAITEAIEWHSLVTEEDMKRLPCGIKPADCLAEWAARLMMRSTYLSNLARDSDSEGSLEAAYRSRSRARELAWCEQANNSGLARVAIQCVTRNALDLHESETLVWLHQQVVAMRTIGLQTRSDEMLQKALVKTETFTEQCQKQSAPNILLSMSKLKLQLNQDLDSLTDSKIDAILNGLYDPEDSLLGDKVYGEGNRRNVLAMYEIAMCHYDERWEQGGDATDQNQSIFNMAACLGKISDLKSRSTVETFLSMLLCRLDQYQGTELPDDLAEQVLSKLDPLTDSLNDFLTRELRRLKHLFPAQALARHSRLNSKLSLERSSRHVLCLQLVCDPEYSLKNYVEDLAQCLKDGDQATWEATFDRMEQLLGNPHAGTAFQLLAKHRAALGEIKHFEIFKDYQTTARQTLRSIHAQLSSQEEKVTLNLGQLCPALASYSPAGREGDDGLGTLLGLKDGVGVVRFERQVQVITGSLRRPCVLRALLSDGRSRRHLVKRGEPLWLDAAAARAHHLFNSLAGTTTRGYTVTPLSDDCAVIEFLEDHVTLRSMIPRAADIRRTVRRPPDDELILASMASTLKQFDEICLRVPAYTLRSSMEEGSLSLQDFLQKRQRFTESLAAMTICHWILGVGDRHLDNYLYDVHSGAAVAIDWGSTLRHCMASRVPELAPARLSRGLLAVCGDTTVLESRLESTLAALRSSCRLLVPVIKVLFRWMPNYDGEGSKKMSYIEDILRGKVLSYHVTRSVLQDTTLIQNPDPYIERLDGIFEEYPVKDTYDVEDQVSCLLRQCTEPRILSVTRDGWEPWL